MLMKELIPTGELAPVAGTAYDLSSPVSMASLTVDDVWFGMVPEKPAVIEWRNSGVRMTLTASRKFGHIPDAELLSVEVALAPADSFYGAIKFNGWHHNSGWG